MPRRRTDEEVMAVLGYRNGPLNRMRQLFSSWSAKIEQAGQQRTPLNPIEMRRLEIEAVEAIQKVVLEEVTRVAGFASYQDGTFELILRNPKTYEETTLTGKLAEGQLQEVCPDLLPTCVYVPIAADPQPHRRALELIVEMLSGDRPTVNSDNALHHFGKLNQQLVAIRDLAKHALAASVPDPEPARTLRVLASAIQKVAPAATARLLEEAALHMAAEDKIVADLVKALRYEGGKDG